MVFCIVKYAVTALVIVVVSEIAKRTERVGALIAALPLVAIMVLVWLHVERQSAEKLSRYAYYTFWYVIPTLPMFLLIPWLLGRGTPFWRSLAAGVVVTVFCFFLTAAAAGRFGVQLVPGRGKASHQPAVQEETVP